MPACSHVHCTTNMIPIPLVSATQCAFPPSMGPPTQTKMCPGMPQQQSTRTPTKPTDQRTDQPTNTIQPIVMRTTCVPLRQAAEVCIGRRQGTRQAWISRYITAQTTKESIARRSQHLAHPHSYHTQTSAYTAHLVQHSLPTLV